MKKVLAASLFALGTLGAGSASALDLNAAVTNEQRQDWGYGLGVTQRYGKVTFGADYTRFDNSGNDQNRWGLSAGYDVAKFGKATLSGKVGLAYLDNSRAADGWATTVGVGARLPLTRSVSAFADYRYQFGQGSVERFDGSAVVLGLSVKF
jgi:hypothetical protein